MRSGGVIAVSRGCAASAPTRGPISPSRSAIRWMCVSTGITGMPSENRSTQLAVFAPTPGSAVRNAIAASGSSSASQPRSSPAGVSSNSARIAWIRGAFWLARPPGRSTATSCAGVASSTSCQRG